MFRANHYQTLKHLFSVLVLSLFCLCFRVSFAKDITLKIPFFKQEGKYWCWAAVTQMLAEKKGVRYSQTEIAGLTLTNDKNGCRGREKDFDRIGYVDDALKACGVSCHGRPGTLSLQEIENELEEGDPIALRVMPPGWENAHFVILYGITGDKFQIWDPEHGGRKLETTRQEMDNTIGRWTNTITIGPLITKTSQHDTNHRSIQPIPAYDTHSATLLPQNNEKTLRALGYLPKPARTVDEFFPKFDPSTAKLRSPTNGPID